MKEPRAEHCGIPLETFLRVGPAPLNLPKELVFEVIFMYSICRIRFSTQMYSSWRTVFLLTFSPFGIKSCTASWNESPPISLGLVPADPGWKSPPVPLKSYFASLSREPGPFQGVLHSALWDVLGVLQTVFWKSSKHLTHLCDIPQGCC